MARYRKIDPRIWNDAKFGDLSDSAKLLFFMLLTHPNMTAIGAMRATTPGLAAELGWDIEDFAEAFQQVLSKGMAEHDERACFIALPKFIQYNPPESPNVVKAWVGALDLLPECSLKTRAVARAKEYAEGMNDGFAKALPKAFAKSMPIQEQEQEQDKEIPPDKSDDLPAVKKTTGKSAPISLRAWIESLSGEDAIPEDDPVFAYADSIRLPDDYIALAWSWFKDAMATKRQKDWRAHFRNAVKGNWPKYWWPTDDGGWRLSPAGEQAKRAAEAKAA